MPKERYENPFLACQHGEYTWCLHCEHAFHSSEWVKNNWECPNKECNGSPLDAQDWDCIICYRPEYPEKPEMGKCYPLYPQ